MKKLMIAFAIASSSLLISSCSVTSLSTAPGYSSNTFTTGYVGYNPWGTYGRYGWGSRWNGGYYRNNYGWRGHGGYNRGWGRRW